jgi:hypothetical protein
LRQEVWGRGYATEIGRAGLDPPPFHRRIEETLERSGLGFAHLRSTAFMQTLAAYLPALIDEEGVFRLPAGAGRVAWVDTSDISAVAFRALIEGGHEGEAYPITGPERSRWRRWPSCSRWPRGHMTYSLDPSAWKGCSANFAPRGVLRSSYGAPMIPEA